MAHCCGLEPRIIAGSHRRGSRPWSSNEPQIAAPVPTNKIVHVPDRQSLIERYNHQHPQGMTERKEWVINIKGKLDEENSYQGGFSIFHVPKSLKKLEPDAFAPHLVSIGPYHRKKEHLKEMEKHKRQLLNHVLQRTELDLDFLVFAMFEIEEETRSCYEKPIDCESEQFVEMMLLDACFILKLFSGTATNGREDPYSLSMLRGFLPYIKRDLLMLENQLPLFVLDRLYALIREESTSNDGVIDPALRFFNSIVPEISENLPPYTRDGLSLVHLLDVVHQSLKPSQKPDDSESEIPRHSVTRPDDSESEIPRHSVTRLRETGIKFQKKKASTKFTDIEFKEGKLLVPTLLIHGSTEAMFLNLMAFEQCYPHCQKYITAYVSFMDGLINSSKDVEHLQKQRIIDHELGSEEDVAHLFNNLRREIVFDRYDFYLSKVSYDLNQHYNQNWRRWTATLKHEYFKDPWKIVALVAAIFLIGLTVAQTVYTAIAYHFPRS